LVLGHFLQRRVVNVGIKHTSMPAARNTPNAMSVFEEKRQKLLEIVSSVKLNCIHLPIGAVLQSVA